jgi:hypothetical protein
MTMKKNSARVRSKREPKAATTTEGSNSLADLAARILAEHEACTAAEKRGLHHAVAAGKMLIEAKAALKHGEWLPWLRDHCHISERKAQRYMAIAPHVVPKSDSVSDLAQPATPPVEWADKVLDQPFTDPDFATGDAFFVHWLMLKLMHHAGVPSVAAFLAAEDEIDGQHPLLRLCTFDDLEAAAKALAPMATGKVPFKIDRDSMADVLESIQTLNALTSWLLGRILSEVEYRFDLGDDERYRSEWHETHAAWMVDLEAKLAALPKRRKKKGATVEAAP